MKKTIYFLSVVVLIVAMLMPNAVVIANNSNLGQKSVTSINSQNYLVSQENELISRILPETSIEGFKKQFSVGASKIRVLDTTGKQEVKTGLIGTGMKVKFDGDEKTYAVSVIGDMTGNGKIEQIEVSKAIKHTVGLEKHQLTGIYAISADVSGDGVVDQKDVSVLIKYVVYGKLDIGELSRPSAPTVQVISGSEGENGWYTSDVILKIAKPETSVIPITSMFYQISGAMVKPQTKLEQQEEVLFDKEGIYEITTYSVAESGVKSIEAKQTIKIDKTAPTSAGLIAKLKDKNGQTYTFGLVANQDVYLDVEGGEDNLSGVQEITLQAVGANLLAKGTKAPVTLTDDGTTTVIVSTKNKAGLVTKKEYTVVIDKVIKEPGIAITKINNKDGANYAVDTWTNQNIYVELRKGADNIRTTYQVEGANQVEETDEARILTKEGISIITVVNRDQVGNISKSKMTVKIDKQKPDAPKLNIKSGLKENDRIDWYNGDVTLQVTQGNTDKGGSGISHTVYEISGPAQIPETRIEDQGTIIIAQDGEHTIKAYNYDIAGNKSEPTTVKVKLDKTAPQEIQITPSSITGTSFHLTVSAKEDASGIALYQIYVDGKLYKEIQSSSKEAECDVTNQSPKVHTVEVKITDRVGNMAAATKQVNMGRLEESDIERVEFVINNFTQRKNNANVSSGADYLVSDTSISQNAKYIQVGSSDAQTVGTVTGTIRVVRKNGEIINEFQYYPANLTISVSGYSDGSGTSWTHEANLNMANTSVTPSAQGTTTNGTVTISGKQDSDNTFIVSDKKLTGTRTYTRLIIQSVTLNGQKIPFTIVRKIS